MLPGNLLDYQWTALIMVLGVLVSLFTIFSISDLVNSRLRAADCGESGEAAGGFPKAVDPGSSIKD